MTKFTVEWTIEIDAASPSEAARAAYQRILAKAHAPTFTVYSDEPDVDGFCFTTVDLDTPANAPKPCRLTAELPL